MLERDLGEGSDFYREVIDMGIRGLDRVQDLIESLLNLEHIESGVAVQCKPVDVRELIDRGLIDVQHDIQENNQKLQLNVPDELPTMMGDMHWLHRALVNLLGNANKYTPPDGEITVRTYVQDNELTSKLKITGRASRRRPRPGCLSGFTVCPAAIRRPKAPGWDWRLLNRWLNSTAGGSLSRAAPARAASLA
jgi:signal transduction histidine kinase